jgi:hypothetical protein
MALCALLALSCNKDDGIMKDRDEGTQTLILDASIGSAPTRLDYKDNSSQGYDATFNGNERIQMYFLNAQDSVIGRKVVIADPYSISDDKKQARFVISHLNIPTGTVSISSYMDSGNAKVSFTDTTDTDDLSLQENITSAQRHHILSGSATLSSTDTPSTLITTIKYAYRTSLLRFYLKFPVRPTADASTPITLSSKNKTLHNYIVFSPKGLSEEASKKGDIVIYPSYVDTLTNTATAMACVWAGDNFKDLRASAVIGGKTYICELGLLKETINAGKVYDIDRSLSEIASPHVWINDESGTVDFPDGGNENVSNDWLTYKDGKISWTANTTGMPRKAKLVFSNGASYELTQMTPADFKGDYSLKCKVFSSNTLIKAANPGVTDGITFSDPLVGESLKDLDGKTYTNQLGIRGLYYTAVLDASVDIDYTNGKVRIGMFLDARDNAQNVQNNVTGYNYACFLPGMGTGTGNSWASPWNFTQSQLSTSQDYIWLWFTVSDDFKTISYDPNTKMQSLKTDLATTANQICAITVAVSKSVKVDPDNVRANWDVVYQGNKYATSTGIAFTRK